MFLLTFSFTCIFSQIRLPKLISNGAIFQRDTDIPIHGWASANELIELNFRSNTYKTEADSSGEWSILLPPESAGGPYEMIFRGKNTISLKNILFGDIWVCSGQSNMELTMDRLKDNYPEVIAKSENPNIRQFLVPDKYDFNHEHNDFDDGNWESANPESLLRFSAVAYFFANELYEKYRIPIGIINAAVGGSPVEAWMSESSLMQFPEPYNEMQSFKENSLIARIEEADKKRSDDWYKEMNSKDAGINDEPKWYGSEVNVGDWEVTQIPGYWNDRKDENINGSAWFRKEIEIPNSMSDIPVKLWMGRIVDRDYVYVNGVLIGTTSYQYPPRKYVLTPGVLKEGKNTITVRVISNSGKGGFVYDKPYFLAGGGDTLSLSGNWKFRQGARMEPLQSQTFIRNKPGGLYNSMIAPIMNFKIKGVIWYQGESNTSNSSEYGKRFETMITSWRQSWNQGDFPFIFVQLANYLEEKTEPAESQWAEIRQAQLETIKVPNTGMAVSIDLGEWNDIHPMNKYDVGKRLALQAERLAYNEHLISAENAIPVRSVFKKRKVVIYFKDTGNGLPPRGKGNLQYFSLSCDTIKYVWADAKIRREKVIVRKKGVLNPVSVRYAWADNPKTANLITSKGLPVSPFEFRAK